MATAQTITATLTDFLSQFTARDAKPHERVERARGALRFSALLTPQSAAEIEAPAEEAIESLIVTLSVTSGLHRGASIELTAHEYLIGSDDDCDIVLRDSGVAPRHCRLVREWRGFTVRDIRAPDQQRVLPQTVRHETGATEVEYNIGGVVLTLLQRDPATATATPPSPEAPQEAQRQASPWTFRVALAAGIVITAITFAAVNRFEDTVEPDSAARIVAGSKALAAQGFDSVRFRQGSEGKPEVAGLVADGAEKERLRHWLTHAGYGDVRVTVRPVADLIEQVRQTLTGEPLQIGLRSGRLRIEGTTRQLSIKNRIRLLTDELRGVIAVDDRVAYVDSREPSAPGPLPVKLRGVMLGNPSYFLTDTGARYFVGGVLPDGAEVLAIEATQIRFRIADRVVVYNLD